MKPELDYGRLNLSTEVVGALVEPPEFDGNNVNLDTIPQFTTAAPNLNYPTRPSSLTAAAPGPAPAVPNRVAPIELDYVLPALPDLAQILVPLSPDINLPEF